MVLILAYLDGEDTFPAGIKNSTLESLKVTDRNMLLGPGILLSSRFD